ncbi:hypothetical protein TW85_14355 [Marinomonas sp. S3726]|uniref:metallophosphoesterase n=1 Tax=Marinomonas sp. S3726 TaxID=579484 RepID=UPI0005FA9507|nr:metallophosphoesterase [Marinomonas sp. S3726]KJZ12799.1 hypothetical protein TW85_14355 [Marinomonas sp. S3726]
MLRLLHISDIHFNSPSCLDERKDRDASIRSLIVDDASTFVKNKKSVDAILVTGDIAFKAADEEFQKASEWLKNLALKVGTKIENIFVVPGNHDINRKVGDTLMVNALRDRILSKKGEDRTKEFLKALEDKDAGNQLLLPFIAYNKFASDFGCAVTPSSPYWSKSIQICSKYKLTLNGLTSTFFSGTNDERSKLFMGDFQSNFMPKKGEIHLAMFHHPYDWLEDGDKIEDSLSNRSSIRLVGHKHRQRVLNDDSGVLFAAAAVNPDREEDQCETGYNIIDLSIIEQSETATLNIIADLRVLQPNPECFVSKQKPNKRPWEYNFEIPLSDVIDDRLNENKTKLVSEKDVKQLLPEASQDNSNIVGRFISLTESSKREILKRLGIYEVSSSTLPSRINYEEALKSISEKGLKKQFIELIIEKEAL